MDSNSFQSYRTLLLNEGKIAQSLIVSYQKIPEAMTLGNRARITVYVRTFEKKTKKKTHITVDAKAYVNCLGKTIP